MFGDDNLQNTLNFIIIIIIIIIIITKHFLKLK